MADPGRRQARRPRVDRHRADEGSAVIWLLAGTLVVGLSLFAAMLVGISTISRHRVENSADLVALSAAQRIGRGPDSCPAAAEVALANSVSLVGCRFVLAPDGRSGTVTVTVTATVVLPFVGNRLLTASSRAGRLPPCRPPARPLPSKAERCVETLH